MMDVNEDKAIETEVDADTESGSEPQVESTAPPTAGLGASATDGLAALQKDLEEARRVAREQQVILTGKDAELSSLREVFDRTKQHLVRLQRSINELRDERHRLGDEAMQVEALKRKVHVLTAERDLLRQQLDSQQKWRD